MLKAEALAATGAARLRALGSVALSLCWVAAGRFDALVTLAACRSVDAAAGQLIVREAGGASRCPDAAGDVDRPSLDLEMRTRVHRGGHTGAARPALGRRPD